ncbi:DMT family transporter [Rhizobium sp. TRM96647]|uniref:DMT family transporter n=1 Tax=unclassified Rhizobium TaxID=2613769 RepID=UPI0021E7CB57|nr:MULTISPECIES: DMT family transporter [unclassified Rhizobium]MCV3736796.1 DMT family transporter [Rhizobium sp. TRM96647]MCV3756804.1 DMT family transporter [Rhizobium sp. TRM96650]
MNEMAAVQPQTMTARTWAMLVFLGLIWGGSFFFARIAVQHIPPVTLVLLRVAIAALALHLYLRGRHGLYETLRLRWREFLAMGLLNNVIPHILIFTGQTEIGAGLAAILNATTPIFTVLIANRLTEDEKMTTAKMAGCLVGLLGTAVLVGPRALAPFAGGTDGPPLWALLLPVAAAASYGLSATYGKRFRGVAPPVTATGQLTASSVVLLPLAAIVDQPWSLPMPPFGVVLAVLALALLSTAYAYILFFRIMAAAGATNTSLVTLLVPPSAILAGVVFLGESISLPVAAGMLLVLLGLVILDGRLLRWART